MDPTEEELKQAFEYIRRPHWVCTFAEYMADPIHQKLLSSLARWLRDRPTPKRPENPPNLPGKYATRWGLRPGELDMKRRASGEKDDD